MHAVYIGAIAGQGAVLASAGKSSHLERCLCKVEAVLAVVVLENIEVVQRRDNILSLDPRNIRVRTKYMEKGREGGGEKLS